MMNRGVLQSSQSWWSINTTMGPPTSNHYHHHHQQQQEVVNSNNNSNSSISSLYFAPSDDHIPNFFNENHVHNHHHHHLQAPEYSWSQLILGGLVDEDDKFVAKKLEDWEEQLLKPKPNFHHHHQNQFGSSTKSCVTNFNSNKILMKSNDVTHPPLDHSSKCNNTATNTGGPPKKPRVQPSSSTQSTFKVRKEKLGDRITALHQMVSPFGKTDTASVLLEAIGYIRFLQSQIEALSLPYLGNSTQTMGQHHQQSVVQGERNSLFPEDPGQLLNDSCMKRKGISHSQDLNEESKDLRSRGLCLVPISCTLQVGSNETGADYWAPATFGGGFR